MIRRTKQASVRRFVIKNAKISTATGRDPLMNLHLLFNFMELYLRLGLSSKVQQAMIVVFLFNLML